MSSRIEAAVVNSDTIVIDGQVCSGKAAVGNALEAALARDPTVVVMIKADNPADYQGIGMVIYASQRAGIAPDNVRFVAGDGDAANVSARATP